MLTTEEKDKLMEETKKRYPPGTVYVPVHVSIDSEDTGNHNIITGTNPIVSKSFIYLESQKGDAGWNHCVAVLQTEGGIKWAPIISTPKKEEPKTISNEELIEEAKRRYPVGTMVISLTPGGIEMPEPEEVLDYEYGDCYGQGIIGIYNMRGYLYANGKWAEIVQKKEELSKCEYKAGDYVVTNSKVTDSWGGIIKIERIENLGSIEFKIYAYKKDGELDWFNSCWIARIATSDEIRSLVKPFTVSGHGLFVGDVLDEKIINLWAREGENYFDRVWQKHSSTFRGNRRIKDIGERAGVKAFLVSDTVGIWLRAEGFKEFRDNYNRLYGQKPISNPLPPVYRLSSSLWEADYEDKGPTRNAGSLYYTGEDIARKYHGNISTGLETLANRVWTWGVDLYPATSKDCTPPVEVLKSGNVIKKEPDVSGYIQTPVILKKRPKSKSLIYVNQ